MCLYQFSTWFDTARALAHMDQTIVSLRVAVCAQLAQDAHHLHETSLTREEEGCLAAKLHFCIDVGICLAQGAHHV